MQIAILLSLVALVAANLPRLPKGQQGPWGDIIGDAFNPDWTIPQNSIVKSISCRGNKRLDYLEVVHRYVEQPSGRVQAQTIGYGDPAAGNPQGSIDLAHINDYISFLAVYICTSGKHKGLVCGLKITTDRGQILNCGVNKDSGYADVPSSWKGGVVQYPTNDQFHTFFVQTRDNKKTITKLGWTLKA